MIVFPTSEHIQQTLTLLEGGDLIGFPTETVYGLAGDATQDLAVAKIFEEKNRPTFNPLILHGSSIKAFKAHVLWNQKAEVLAQAFWPGPLTLVLPRLPTSTVSLLASAGLDSLAVRVPNHPVALRILSEIETLIAAPSANPSGKTSPTQPIHVEEDFPHLLILDGGNACVGVESTIVDLTGSSPLLLRPGGISREEIENLIGPLKTPSSSIINKAPGMMKSHYAPKLPLRLNCKAPSKGEGYLAFGHTSYQGTHVLNLSESGDLREAAANLFKMIRSLDQETFQGLAVAPIPSIGLGEAINDRLQRAAAPREL